YHGRDTRSRPAAALGDTGGGGGRTVLRRRAVRLGRVSGFSDPVRGRGSPHRHHLCCRTPESGAAHPEPLHAPIWHTREPQSRAPRVPPPAVGVLSDTW